MDGVCTGGDEAADRQDDCQVLLLPARGRAAQLQRGSHSHERAAQVAPAHEGTQGASPTSHITAMSLQWRQR